MRMLRLVPSAVLVLTALLGSPASANIPVGAATHTVAINHTTGLAYVGAACTCGGSVIVIDTATDSIVTTITTVATPTQIAIDEERNQIFAAHFATANVSVIDGATNSVVTMLTPGGLALAVDPARDVLYATLGPGGLAYFDLNTLAYVDTVPSNGMNWWGVAVNPVTDRIYLEILQGAVAVMDGANHALIGDPVVTGAEARLGITVDVAANRIYVPRASSPGQVSVIDGATNTVTGFAPSGSFPFALALDTAADRLYSADLNSGTITVMSTAGTLTRLSTIVVGGTPTGVALPTLGPRRLYVTNSSSPLGEVIVLPLNSPPSIISVSISPSSPDTDDVLTATVVAQDPDGDPLTHSYQWTKGGADIVGATSATLYLAVEGNGDRDEEIAVRVTTSDGSATSAPVTSDGVVIQNTVPSVSVTLTPTSPTSKALLTADVAVSDADGDAVSLTYVWTVDGVVRRTVTTMATSDQLDLSLPHNGNPHDTVSVTVIPNDDIAVGADATDSVKVVPGSGH